MRIKTYLLGTSAAVALFTAMPVFAQDAAAPATQAAPAAASSIGDPSDIIVTARKRQESILKVPVVETAITQATLEKYQVTNLSNIAAKVPGLVLGSSVLSIGTQVSIRGVGTSSLDAGIDQSVTLNIDGLSLSQGTAYTVGAFDLAQAEILKGPQALFFGKAATAGVISLRTADPTDRVETMARIGYNFNADGVLTEGYISGPLTDTLGVRVAARYSHDDGYFRNAAVATPGFGGRTPTHRDIPTENFIIRGTAVYKPDPAFNARLKVNVSRLRIDGSGGDGQLASCPDGTNRAPFGVPFLSPAENCKLDGTQRITWLDPAAFHGVRNSGELFSQVWQKFGSLELNYTPAEALTLTSVTGYYDGTFDGLLNGVEAEDAGSTLSADNHFTRKEFTQEIRLNSDYSGPLNFTLGGFYQDATERNRIIILGNTFLGLPETLSRGRHKLDINSYSGFGQLRYKVVPKLELSGGVRFTHEKRGDDIINDTPPPLGVGTTPYPIAVPQIKSNTWSPEVTLTWTPTDDLTVFGSLKQAYKSGSYNITTIPAPIGADLPNNSFGDEKVQGGEIGLKARGLDRRLTVNLAGYYYYYKGLQVGANQIASDGLPVLRTINAGAARVYGLDFDLAYRPPSIDELTLRAAVNWNHARFKKLSGVPCVGGQSIAEGCDRDPTATGVFTNQDLSGGRLVRAPTWQVNFGFDYDVPLSNGWKLSLSSDSRWSSRYLDELLGRSDMYQGSFFKTDATVAVSGPDDAWEIALIGTNLTNKYTTGNCANFDGEAGQIFPGGQNTGTNLPRGPTGIDELTCQADRGREVWLRFTVHPDRLFK